jgi:hypothetical protein
MTNPEPLPQPTDAITQRIRTALREMLELAARAIGIEVSK